MSMPKQQVDRVLGLLLGFSVENSILSRGYTRVTLEKSNKGIRVVVTYFLGNFPDPLIGF